MAAAQDSLKKKATALLFFCYTVDFWNQISREELLKVVCVQLTSSTTEQMGPNDNETRLLKISQNFNLSISFLLGSIYWNLLVAATVQTIIKNE